MVFSIGVLFYAKPDYFMNKLLLSTAIRRMSGMVDKEFQEGNLDIFGVYEFAMLSDDAIQQLLISRGVIHPEINK